MTNYPENRIRQHEAQEKQPSAGTARLAAVLMCAVIVLAQAAGPLRARAIELPDDVFVTPAPTEASGEDELPIIDDDPTGVPKTDAPADNVPTQAPAESEAADNSPAKSTPSAVASGTAGPDTADPASAEAAGVTAGPEESIDPDATPVPTYNGNVIKFEVPEEGGRKNTSSAGGVIMLIIIGLELISVVTGIVEQIIKAVRHRNDGFKVE